MCELPFWRNNERWIIEFEIPAELFGPSECENRTIWLISRVQPLCASGVDSEVGE